jgi:VanZ family protein
VVGIDKILHVLAYAGLGLLAIRAMATLSFKNHPCRLVLYSIAMAGLYGASDEWHQLFVAGRNAELLDVLADFIGAALGVTSYYGLVFKKRRHPSNPQLTNPDDFY